jgi:hypothetical protein
MEFIARKIQELENITAQYENEFSGLPDSDMDLKPAADVWSINECLDHVVQSNASYKGMIQDLAAGSYQASAWTRVPLFPIFWGKMIMKAVSPEHTGKSKTFPIWLPLKSNYGRNLTADFAAANGTFAESLRGLKDADFDRIVVSSPAGKFVTYTLRNAIDILVAHEKRHFNQAKRVKENLPEGKP